jgi:hypothetical protein
MRQEYLYTSIKSASIEQECERPNFFYSGQIFLLIWPVVGNQELATLFIISACKKGI